MTELLELCAELPTQSWSAGEVLIELDQPPAAMYVLTSGWVGVERDGTTFARIDEPGAVLGEMSVVLGQRATATVRAGSDVTCRVVADAHAFLTDRPGAALVVLRTTASRLDQMSRYLLDVKQQLASETGHLAMVGQILDTLLYQQSPVQPGSERDPDG